MHSCKGCGAQSWSAFDEGICDKCWTETKAEPKIIAEQDREEQGLPDELYF